MTRKDKKAALKKAFDKLQKGGGVFYIKDEKETGIKRFIAKEGTNYLNILERPDSDVFYEEIYVHYDVGPNHYAFLCPAKMGDEYCPVCSFRQELENEGESDDILREFWPSRRFIMFIVDAENKRSIRDGVQVYDCPKTVVDNIAAITLDERTGEVIDISDPGERLTLVFKRIGTKINTDYKGFKIEEWNDDMPAELLDDVPEMNEVLIQPDIALMKKAMNMDDSPDVAEEIEDIEEEKPRKTRRRKAVKGESEEDEEAADPAEDVVFDEEDEDAEEEKPKPRRTRRSKITRRAKEEVEEEDDEKENSRQRVKRASVRGRRRTRK